MGDHKKCNNPTSRREFLRRCASVTTGGLAFAYAYSLKPRITNARTPGLTGSRVAWVQDSNAMFWDGSTGCYGNYVDQQKANAMIDRGVRELTGTSNTVSA